MASVRVTVTRVDGRQRPAQAEWEHVGSVLIATQQERRRGRKEAIPNSITKVIISGWVGCRWYGVRRERRLGGSVVGANGGWASRGGVRQEEVLIGRSWEIQRPWQESGRGGKR
jgi:hypothetical protein